MSNFNLLNELNKAALEELTEIGKSMNKSRFVKLTESVESELDPKMEEFYDKNEALIWAEYANRAGVDLKDIDDEDVDKNLFIEIVEGLMNDKGLEEAFHPDLTYTINTTDGKTYQWKPGKTYTNQDFMQDVTKNFPEIKSAEDIKSIDEVMEESVKVSIDGTEAQGQIACLKTSEENATMALKNQFRDAGFKEPNIKVSYFTSEDGSEMANITGSSTDKINESDIKNDLGVEPGSEEEAKLDQMNDRVIKGYKCSNCGKRIKDVTDFKMTKNGDYICPKCGEVYSFKDLDNIEIKECETPKTKGKKIKLVDDEIIRVNKGEAKPDYIIEDVTVIEDVNDGDVQSPDIEALLSFIEESIKEEYGEGAINIHVHSSNILENGSFALVDITTPEILKEFEDRGIKDAAVGKNLILEKVDSGYRFKVNSLYGSTRFTKVAANPIPVIKEWIETEFLQEAKKEIDTKRFEARCAELKNIIEFYLLGRPQLQLVVDLIKEMISAKIDDAIIQDKIYQFIAEFPASVHVKQDTDGIKFDVDDSTELAFDSRDDIVDIIFGSKWVRKDQDELGNKELKEEYQNITIGNIEVVYNPQTQECLYSIESADIHDKKINLSKIPDVEIPYDTETIIRDNIEKMYGPIPAEEVENETTIETNETPAETEVPTEITEADDDVPSIGEPDAEETPAEDVKSETGAAIFGKIRPNNPVSVEGVRQKIADGLLSAESTYIVVQEINLPQEQFEEYSKDLTKPQDFFTGVAPLDRKNYQMNVVKISSEGSSYSILADPTRLRVWKVCSNIR